MKDCEELLPEGEAEAANSVRSRWASHVFRWRLVLAFIALICVCYLISGTPPWDKELQARITERDIAETHWRAYDYGYFYGWIAAAAIATISILLALTASLWGRPGDPQYSGKECLGTERSPSDSVVSKRVFLALLAVILGIGAFERWPKLDHSFWNDEEHAFARYVWGIYRPAKKDGGIDGIEFKRMGWSETLFRNRMDNHVLHSVFARLAHDFWAFNLRSETDPPFREPVIRAFPFLFGLASIAAIAVLFGILGHRVAGLCAGLFLALSPWHIRFSGEGRGYIYAMFFLTLAFIFLLYALAGGGWKHWIGFALCQSASFLANFGTVYVLFLLNLGLIFYISMGNRRTGVLHGDRGLLFRRWLVANIIATMVVLPLTLPAVPQVIHVMQVGFGLNRSMDFTWWREVWTLLSSGTDWSVSDESLHGTTSAVIEMSRSGLFWLWVCVLCPVLILIGMLRSVFTNRFILLAGLTIVFAALLMWYTNERRSFFLHSWYVNYLLVAAAIFLGIGCGLIVDFISKIARNSAVTSTVTALVLAAIFGTYFVGDATAREAIRKTDRQPAKQAIAQIRQPCPFPLGGDEGPVVVSVGPSFSPIESYEPRNIHVKDLESFQKAVDMAKAGGRELWVVYTGRSWSERDKKAGPIIECCDDPDRFELVAHLLGTEEWYSFWVFKMLEQEQP